MAFRPANCPKCGGALQVPDDKEMVNCMYCSAPIIVKDIIQVQVKVNVENLLQLANTAAEGGNYSEAYRYFSQVLEADGRNAKAWMGKGDAAAWTSTLANLKLNEMIVSFQKAIELTPDDEKERMMLGCSLLINQFCNSYFLMSHKHLNEFISLDSSWSEHLDRSFQVISALEIASAYNPSSVTIMENIVHICKNNMEGTKHWDEIQTINITRGVSSEHEARLKDIYNNYSAKISALNPDYQPPTIEKQSGPCFVITAVMGDTNHPIVNDFRDIRDMFLLPTELGRRCVNWYYVVGPYFANAISRFDFARTFAYYLFILPVATLFRMVCPRRKSA